MALASTLAKVLGSLPPAQKEILYNHSQKHAFHRGRQWFGAGMRVVLGADVPSLAAEVDVPCPVAAAFNVRRDSSELGWFSAKLDERLLAAIKHIVTSAGKSEEGMEQYLKELENTDPVELHRFVEGQYLALAASRRSLTAESRPARSRAARSSSRAKKG
jgi:hypothetical protein